ncbi:hypothetical protein [Lonepinella sp. MS14435]
MFKKLLLATLIGMSFPTSSYANEINDLTTKAEAGDFFLKFHWVLNMK